MIDRIVQRAATFPMMVAQLMHKQGMHKLRKWFMIWTAVVIFMGLFSAVVNGKEYNGPYTATIERVVDGDTVSVMLVPWFDSIVRTNLRISGIDTPEIKGKCEDERVKAQEAAAFLRRQLPAGTEVTLHGVTKDKYGRLLAVVMIGGRSVADIMITNGHARPYDGRKRLPWC